MWCFKKRQPPPFLTGDNSPGSSRRRELSCPGHKKDYGEQIDGITVRWYCKCGAYRDEIDAPPPHGADMPTGDYLEMQLRGMQGQSGPWRSQVTGKPLPVQREPKPPTTSNADNTPASTNTGGTSMAGIEEVQAAVASTRDKGQQILAALAQIQEWAREVTGQLNTAMGMSQQPEAQQAIGAFNELAETRVTELHQLVAGAIDQAEQYSYRL
ncbi:hypothetical protein [Saccharopolyspora hordei]|uniref:Uncharacterized protein n=1 Tax=Saccharopolyspora hordei TaxID=1838 RepID=A0A853AUR3_9PSEU|nr:hypothetical protein [Saccharopolyspora hordei]NYI86416.1 hypothetical protein [Saccharopolyspora hordei]